MAVRVTSSTLAESKKSRLVLPQSACPLMNQTPDLVRVCASRDDEVVNRDGLALSCALQRAVQLDDLLRLFAVGEFQVFDCRPAQSRSAQHPPSDRQARCNGDSLRFGKLTVSLKMRTRRRDVCQRRAVNSGLPVNGGLSLRRLCRFGEQVVT